MWQLSAAPVPRIMEKCTIRRSEEPATDTVDVYIFSISSETKDVNDCINNKKNGVLQQLKRTSTSNKRGVMNKLCVCNKNKTRRPWTKCYMELSAMRNDLPDKRCKLEKIWTHWPSLCVCRQWATPSHANMPSAGACACIHFIDWLFYYLIENSRAKINIYIWKRVYTWAKMRA